MAAPQLPDAEARHLILSDLADNLVVEAAAGTGKTTCLVGRLINLFRHGALSGEARLAAVTFTTKAASELRERLEAELAARLADETLPPDERAHLAAAEANLGECHIGTIHSFCARLIRERPVEAGVGPDFSELEEEDDALLRRQAWDMFAARLVQGEYPDLRRTFETYDLDLEALYPGFDFFAEYPDIDAWPGADYDGAGRDECAFFDSVLRFNADLDRFRPALHDADPGNDGLLALMQILDRRCARLPGTLPLRDCHRLSRLFKANLKPVLSAWRGVGIKNDKEGKERVREEHDAYQRFHADHVLPFVQCCQAEVYAAALRGFRLAADIYDTLRRERRVLNFQDLLLAAARLLRNHPQARADLAARYAKLLVDEVQDTDPLQAEIMFLLASGDDNGTVTPADWRQCRLRPGALFMVGDPKQSIYRFRRADIEVYQEMKNLITGQGGRSLGLTANFRSHPAVIAWVNLTYGPARFDSGKTPEEMALSGRFPREESRYNPAYIPLEVGRPAPEGSCFSGVYYMESIPLSTKAGIGEKEVLADEAARIAAFIRHAVDTGLPIPDKGTLRPARAGDFMIVPYKKKAVGAYADAVRCLGLACQASGASQLAESRALGLLSVYLRALAQPDDGVRLLAALRGGLFGVSDQALFAWKQAGNVFDFRRQAVGAADADSPLQDVFALMRHHADAFAARHPLTALDNVMSDLGLWELAGLDEDPSLAVGAIADAMELLRRDAQSVTSLGALSQRLDELRENHAEDSPPALGDNPDAVRVMNLHKTKGLEAPVVFLTGTRRVKAHPAAFAVRRQGNTASGAMAIMTGEHRNTRLAQPLEWDEMAKEEELFLAAERTRLNYVAATRAGAALVVTVHQSNRVWQSAFLPGAAFEPGETIAHKLPEPEGPIPVRPPAVLATLPADAETAEQVREARRAAILAPTYAAVRAKPDDVAPASIAPGALSPELALRFGEAVHALLAGQTPAEDQLPPELSEEAAAMAEAVRRTAIWRRAEQADQCFRETPFTLAVERDGLPTLQHGVIDLAFREGEGWVVVDYKSDTLAPDADAAAEAMRHREQLSAYAQAWQRITGGMVVEAGICFTRTGQYAVVDIAT